MSLVLSSIMSEVAFRQEPSVAAFVAAFGMFFLAFAGFLCYYFHFDWQFWTITRDVTLTMNPFQGSLTVESPTFFAVLTPDTITRIEHHLIKVGNSKSPFNGYGYYLFFGNDGQTTRLNTIFFSHVGHFEFMECFFGHVPQTLIWHSFPWNPDFIPIENLKSPNFDSLSER